MKIENTIEVQILKDAQKLAYISSQHTKEQIDTLEVLQAITFFSFSMERLLKYILAKINPIFTLKSGDFKNAVPILYKNIQLNQDEHSQISTKPDQDVISFRVALQRATLFSKSVQVNKQFLYSLAKYRDILAHRHLDELDITETHKMLVKDGYKVMLELCNELSLQISDFFLDNTERLSAVSAKLQEDEPFTRNMRLVLNKHKNIWIERSKNSEIVTLAKSTTKAALRFYDGESSSVEFNCPACGNEAVVTVVPDWDYCDAEQDARITGIFVDKIHCYYCSLNLENYNELDFVNVNSILEDM